MNNGAQGGQPPAGQQPGQQPNRKVVFFKPEQMRQLPAQFTQPEKEKYEQGLRNLWAQMARHPEDSDEHKEARKKISDFSNTLYQKMASYRSQAAQRQAAAQQGQGDQSAARPQSQGQPQQQQQSGGEASGGSQNAAQQTPRPQTIVSQKILDHVNSFPFNVPNNLTRGTPEATKHLNEIKSRYARALSNMETASLRIRTLDDQLQKRIASGNPFTPAEEAEWKEKKEMSQKNHNDLKTFAENFRRQHSQPGQQSSNAAGGASNSNSSGVKPQQQTNTVPGQDGPTRPQLNPQQPAPSATNPALQNTQTVNAAIEAARNQQISGSRPVPQNGQIGQPASMQNAPSNMNMSQQPGQNQNSQVKMEAPPPLNTAVNQVQNQHRNSIGNNSPQSAVPQSGGPQSATQQGPPRALSHSAALQAARTYSTSQSAGASVMGHSHPSAPARESQNVITNKMPIPKHLPERAVAPPQPVAMAASRPTYSGGAGNNNAIGSQPVIHQPPNISNLAENGGRVLDKNKLEELVRQVTGGGQGLEGGGTLTPDVESSIMDVADNFVDQVLEAACRNAKERGSKILEIRDIQLTLERGYNIRIPGYASDEIRTVRKIAPSAQWIAKMSAVQAAKVTGGKNAD